MVTATTYCLPKIVRWLFITSYSLLSLWGLYKVRLKSELRPSTYTHTAHFYAGFNGVVTVGTSAVLSLAFLHAYMPLHFKNFQIWWRGSLCV